MANTTALDFAKIQAEVSAWSLYNFGVQPAHRPLLGIAEEIGELQEGLEKFDQDMVKDALGDIAIYTFDYSSRENIDLSPLNEMASLWAYKMPVMCNGPAVYVLEMVKLLGKLNHAHLKTEQGIRKNEDHAENKTQAIRGLYRVAFQLADFIGVDFLQEVTDTWAKVSKRDWKKNANTGSVQTA